VSSALLGPRPDVVRVLAPGARHGHAPSPPSCDLARAAKMRVEVVARVEDVGALLGLAAVTDVLPLGLRADI